MDERTLKQGTFQEIGIWKFFIYSELYGVVTLAEFLFTHGGWPALFITIWGGGLFIISSIFFLMVTVIYSKTKGHTLLIRRKVFYPALIFTFFYQTLVAVLTGETYYDNGHSFFIQKFGIGRESIPTFIINLAQGGYILVPCLIFLGLMGIVIVNARARE